MEVFMKLMLQRDGRKPPTSGLWCVDGQTIPSVVKSATGSIYQPPSCLIWDPAAPTLYLDFVIY